jgi:hypothetical protein
MSSPTVVQTAREFISESLKAVLEAPNGEAAVAAMLKIFDRQFKLFLNGAELNWSWLEEHVREVHTRLLDVTVDVTHAVRNGNVLMERHIVAAVARETGEHWKMEVMAVYELTNEQRIGLWHELAQSPTSTYPGW